MNIAFFTAESAGPSGERVTLRCAATPSGLRVYAPGADAMVIDAELGPDVPRTPVAVIDLEGVDRDTLEYVVDRILTGPYLDKLGIANQDDALLYVLVNEALQDLQQAERDLAEDDAAPDGP